MTDKHALIQPDRGQAATPIHLVDKAGLDDFIKGLSAPQRAALAGATASDGDRVALTNSAWSFSCAALRAARGAPRQAPSVMATAGRHAESPCAIRLADFRIGETAPQAPRTVTLPSPESCHDGVCSPP